MGYIIALCKFHSLYTMAGLTAFREKLTKPLTSLTKRWWNYSDFSRYFYCIKNNNLPVEKSERISLESKFVENIFLGLRTSSGINLTDFKNEFPEQLIANLKKNIDLINKRSPYYFIQPVGNILRLSREGMLLLDEIINQLL